MTGVSIETQKTHKKESNGDFLIAMYNLKDFKGYCRGLTARLR